MQILRWDLYVIDRCVVRRRKRLTYQDALGGAVSWLTVEKRTHQNSAETYILLNLLTPLYLLYTSLRIPLAYCYSKSFRGVSSLARPEHEGENMPAVWVSQHEALCCDGVVARHGFAPLMSSDLGVVLARCDPPGAAVDAGLEAATQARRAERTADGGVVDVPQALHVSPSAPRINAQRVARFDHYCAHKCLLEKELRRNIQ